MAKELLSVSELDLSINNNPFPSPMDWRDQFIYFLLVDRFDNNETNLVPFDPRLSHRGRDPEQGKVFQGGKIKGITRRLEYIKNLGCTTIWLSPVLKNRQEINDSYHGYGIQNFLEVDRRFGTIDDLVELVTKAHSINMYVIMDIILNHTGDNWAYPGDYPYYYWKDAPGPFDFGFWRMADTDGGEADNGCLPAEIHNPDSYKRRGQIRNWSDSDESINGDFLTLKELNINKPDVLDTLIKSYKYWIAAADIDGFRIDTVKHMEDSDTAIFCNALREYAKRIGKHNFFIFGEVVGDDLTLQRYIGRNSRIPGTNERFPSLDACLDFPLYFILEETIKGFISSQSLRDRYDRFKTVYADHGEASRYFVTFVDNHDQMSRPYRRFMNNNPFPAQAVLAIGYLLTSQGVPCIYYGTEQGFDGGGDNDSYVRETMFGGNWGAFDTTGVHFFNEQNQIFCKIKTIADIRTKQAALRYGRLYFREISDDGAVFGFPTDGNSFLAYSRILDSDEVLVILNLASSDRIGCVTVDRNLTPKGTEMVDMLTDLPVPVEQSPDGRSFVRVKLAGHQMAIMRLVKTT